MCPSVCFPSVQLWREVVALSLPLCVFVFVCLCLCVSLSLCVQVYFLLSVQVWHGVVVRKIGPIL